MVTKINGQFFGSNTYIITNNNNQALIIDAGASVEEITKHTQGLNVVGVLLTHCHFDHSYFLEQITKHFNCPAFVGGLAKPHINSPLLTLGEAFGAPFNFPQNVTFVAEGNFNVGDFNVECIFTPGHSADSVCFLVGSMLFCGDTLFLDAIGRTDLALSSVDDMVLSLKKLKNVKFDTALSGHGRQSSYSDQQQNIDYFIDLLQNLSKYQ